MLLTLVPDGTFDSAWLIAARMAVMGESFPLMRKKKYAITRILSIYGLDLKSKISIACATNTH